MDPPSRIEDAAETERSYPRQARTPFNVTGHPGAPSPKQRCSKSHEPGSERPVPTKSIRR